MSPRSPLPTVILHWSFVLALVVSFVTGMRIASDALDAGVTRRLEPLLPQGNVFEWHLLAGMVLAALALGYGVYLVRAGLAGRFRLPRRGRGWSRWAVVNVLVYWLLCSPCSWCPRGPGWVCTCCPGRG